MRRPKTHYRQIALDGGLQSRKAEPTLEDVRRWHIVCRVTCSVSAIDTVISGNASAQTEFLPRDFPQYEEERRRLAQHGAVTCWNIALALESSPVVVGDSARPRQLFSNLIDKAIKYVGMTRNAASMWGVGCAENANRDRKVAVNE
jgi:hypothetical protein